MYRILYPKYTWEQNCKNESSGPLLKICSCKSTYYLGCLVLPTKRMSLPWLLQPEILHLEMSKGICIPYQQFSACWQSLRRLAIGFRCYRGGQRRQGQFASSISAIDQEGTEMISLKQIFFPTYCVNDTTAPSLALSDGD